MTDIVDQGNDEAELFLEASLKTHKAHAMDMRLAPTGSCHWCGDSVLNGNLFCSPDCRDDHDKDEQIRARQRGELGAGRMKC